MATSESEDFESADEDIELDIKRKQIKEESKISGKHLGTGDHKELVKLHEKEERGSLNATFETNMKISDNTSAKYNAGADVNPSTKNNIGSCSIGRDANMALNEVQGTDQDSSSKTVPQMSGLDVWDDGGWDDGKGDWEDGDDDLDLEENHKPDGSKEAKISSVFDKLAELPTEKEANPNGSGGWGGWGSWGVSSLLSTATESVSTLTSHVSQGLSTVLETGLGATSPEELARLDHERDQALLYELRKEKSAEPVEIKEEKIEDGTTKRFGFGRMMSGMSSITKLVETAGTKVVTGGLDTLETIGKKTMEVLQEGDPGLKKKRALFSEKILLSQVLREAKEKAEQEDKEIKDKEEARKAHFETLFDDYKGLVHLEALEMLSKQCDLKLQSVLLTNTGPSLAELQKALAELKDQCQLPDDEDVEDVEEVSSSNYRDKLVTVGKGLGVHVATDKLVKTWDETEEWLVDYHKNEESLSSENGETCRTITAKEIHQKAIGTLARLTAESVEQFHKAAELLLVLEERNPSEEARILLEMTSILCSQVTMTATRFSECLNVSPENSVDQEAVNSLITNVFLEAAHSSNYIQEAFQLLVPVLQVGIMV